MNLRTRLLRILADKDEEAQTGADDPFALPGRRVNHAAHFHNLALSPAVRREQWQDDGVDYAKLAAHGYAKRHCFALMCARFMVLSVSGQQPTVADRERLMAEAKAELIARYTAGERTPPDTTTDQACITTTEDE